MSLRRLPLVFPPRRVLRRLEREDLRQAVVRVARARWGEELPLVVLGTTRGFLHVGVPSIPWRTELLFSEWEFLSDLAVELPAPHAFRGLRVSLVPHPRM